MSTRYLKKCHVCQKTLVNLEIHMRIHTGELPFECNVCKKKFSTLGNLKVHTRIHTGERPFECNICHLKFSHSGNLKTHALIHTGENRVKCNICQTTFSSVYQLKKHIRKVHTAKNESFNSAVSLNGTRVHDNSDYWSKPCVFCNKIFSSPTALNNHLRSHIQERPFFCNVCGKEYGTVQRRDFHLKTHQDNLQRLNKRESQLSPQPEITNGVDSNATLQSSPTCNGYSSMKNDVIEHHRIPTILVQHSIAILASVIQFEQSGSNVLIISTCHISITYQTLQRTVPHIPIFHKPEDCFSSPHVVKALVCDENYESILVAANQMNKKIILVINATEKVIKEKISQYCDNYRIISDKFQWSDLTVTLQFQVLQNWKKRFGFSLNSEQMDYIEGEFLISLVYDKDCKTLQYYMPLELKRCVNKMRQKKIAGA